MSRVLHAAATLVAAFALAFVLLQAMPGDPRDRLEDRALPAAQAERTRRALGLDAPLPVQFVRTVASYAQGDLGVSFTRHRPVVEVLGDAVPYSAALGAGGLAIAYGVGLMIAGLVVACGPRVRSAAARALLVGTVTPRFWLAVVLVGLFHAALGWLPASEAASLDGGGPADLLRHLVLPALALGLPAAANVARTALAAAERLRSAPHLRRARAAGASGVPLAVRHILRPALVPVAALAGLDASLLLSGALVVETVFAWPGVGRLAAESVLASDYPLGLACSVMAAAAVVGGRLVGDALVRRADPAVGAGERAR